jgi:hypothetical protein
MDLDIRADCDIGLYRHRDGQEIFLLIEGIGVTSENRSALQPSRVKPTLPSMFGAYD